MQKDSAFCEFYNNCTKVYFQSELTTDSKYVKLVNASVDLIIEEELGPSCRKSEL